ncbi:hypothetical protein N7532_008802 [Penicillium argentinense]|uniref:Uncharacterized protein n=1 Tax=Penicillium argentinense TaxID=1131581 RepID=A0A9W9K204_9EURO|nr:uncharacterized protein N7532_008802 [Penicillium argentinense]KAJ5090118.1 hypothetical protein N7532_008802 [Penicillium argentinense]
MAVSIIEQDQTVGETSPGSPNPAESTSNGVEIERYECLESERSTGFEAQLTPSQTQARQLQCSQYFNHASSTEILELYSVLWNCYTMGKTENHNLQQEIKMLRSVNSRLCLRLQVAEQETCNQKAVLAYSEQRFANLQENLRNLLHFENIDGSEVNSETAFHQGAL